MKWLIVIASFLALCNVTCAFIDFVLPVQYKRSLHINLIKLWYALSQIEIKDYPRVAALATIKFKDYILGQRPFSFRSVSISIVFSLFLTTYALSFGLWLRERNFDIERLIDQFFILFGKHMHILYISNLVFDIATIVITILILSYIVEHRLKLYGAILLCIDAFIAFLLAVGCIIGVALLSEIIGKLDPSIALRNNFVFPVLDGNLLKNSTEAVIDTTNAFISLGRTGARYDIYGIYAVTTFIPTLIYVFFLIFLISSYVIFTFSHQIALQAFDATTAADPSRPDQERNFKPFSTLGMLITVIAAFLSFIVVLWQNFVIPPVKIVSQVILTLLL